MSQENAFLQAVLNEPDDMTHRLVYADWLEDRGDAAARDRAAFIRAQIERETLHPARPRARELLAVEKALLAMHETAWAGPVASMVGRWWFHRGFVEEATVDFDSLPATMDRLARVAPIRRLRLRHAGLLASLTGTAAAVRERYALALCRIRNLDLGREALGEQAVLGLVSLPLLPLLEGLSLGHATLTAAVLGPLMGSRLLAWLKTLAVSSLSLDALQGLAHSTQLGRLETLSLAGAHLGDRPIHILAGSPLVGKLRALSLGHNHLTAADLRELVATRLADALESLDLGFNRLGPEGARVLAASGRLRRLKHLNLSRTGLGDEGATILADSPLFGRLESLDLSLNGIGSEGALALARSKQPARPMMLDLVYNSAIGLHGRQALVEGFGASVCVLDRDR